MTVPALDPQSWADAFLRVWGAAGWPAVGLVALLIAAWGWRGRRVKIVGESRKEKDE